MCGGSNEPPQNLLFENTSAPTLTNIQLTKFQKYGQTYPNGLVAYSTDFDLP